MQNTDLNLLDHALTELKRGFTSFPDTLTSSNSKQIEAILIETAQALHNNYPYFQPEYAGQMLKPPHAIARLAYMLSLYINPNNHALDGSRASSPMEKECVQKIGKMYGWQNPLGHLSSGGTMANLEALWVAGQINPDKYVVASDMSHYTHERISAVLKLPFKKVKTDRFGRMDITALSAMLESHEIGTVVVTLGTTGLGSLDPLSEILKLKKTYNFRIHVDAAYGGYFTLIENLTNYARRQYDAISHVDSLVIDPHKHGLQPYGCGCILFSDPSVGKYYRHESPYTYFTSDELHLGEISLECSRPGASAVALWATMKLLPLTRGGEFAKQLEQCRNAALKLFENLNVHPEFLPLGHPELDIVVWGMVANSFSEMSSRANHLFRKCANKGLHLALIQIPGHLIPDSWGEVERDQEYVTCMRSCLMKPEHFAIMDKYWEILTVAIQNT